MNYKVAIGCLIQWYECEMVWKYLDSLRDAINFADDNEKIIVDILVSKNQDLERCSIDINICIDKIKNEVKKYGFECEVTEDLITISDYRRNFNNKYCNSVDILMWGESDSIIPEKTFLILDALHNMSINNGEFKYIAFFGTCKMWDRTWTPVEHVKFTNKKYSKNKNDWWTTSYVMTKEEMNKINNEGVEKLNIKIIKPHKFNGCGLVLSSEIVRAGANIPNSAFFVHEDTSLMMITNKLFPNAPQYVINNILLVHNRNDENKRNYILDESDKNNVDEKRNEHNWYKIANIMCNNNCYRLFENGFKSFSWDDVWKKVNNLQK